MNRDDVIAIVRQQGNLSDEQAEAGLLATLDLLGERVTGGAADAIAAALPGELAAPLRNRAREHATPRSATEIGDAVAERLDLQDALAGLNVVQASMRAVAAAVDDPKRLDAIRDQLPLDLQRMLLQEREGDTSAVHSSVEVQRPR